MVHLPWDLDVAQRLIAWQRRFITGIDFNLPILPWALAPWYNCRAEPAGGNLPRTAYVASIQHHGPGRCQKRRRSQR